MPLWPPASRIRREVLHCLGVRVYAIGVDKKVLLIGGGGKLAVFRPQKTAAKSYCVRFRFLQEWDSQVTAPTRPASAGFSFLGHRISFRWLRRTGQNRDGPDRVCPNIFHTASAMQLSSVFPKLYNYDQRTEVGGLFGVSGFPSSL